MSPSPRDQLAWTAYASSSASIAAVTFARTRVPSATFPWRRLRPLAWLALAALPPLAWMTGRTEVTAFLLVMALMVWIRHSQNIRRLLDGTEPLIGAKKTG